VVRILIRQRPLTIQMQYALVAFEFGATVEKTVAQVKSPQ